MNGLMMWKCQFSHKTEIKPTDHWFCYKQEHGPYYVLQARVKAGSAENARDAQRFSEGLSTCETGCSFIHLTDSLVHTVWQALCQVLTLQTDEAVPWIENIFKIIPLEEGPEYLSPSFTRNAPIPFRANT